MNPVTPNPASPNPADWPTLADYAAGGRGLVCPSCGCRHFKVIKVVQGDRVIQRRRQCRHCGRRISTVESWGGGGETL